jgi:predicted dehydrogenase
MAYRGAVVGHGALGARHAQVLHGLEQTELVAVCDGASAARAAAKEAFPHVTLYEDAKEMFEREELDIVAVATHAVGHAPLSLLAADYGVHVVCEKPIAANLEEADAMVARFEAANLQLVIDHQWRIGPAAEKAAALLLEGAIGRLLTIKVNFCKGRPAGWELNEMGTHVFDMVCKFAGNPRDCAAHIFSADHDAGRGDIMRGNELHPGSYNSGWVVGTAIGATFRFDSGVLMLAEGYTAEPDAKSYVNERILIELRGTGGRLRLTGGAFDAIYRAKGAYPEDAEHNIPWQQVEVAKRPERSTMPEFATTIAPVYEYLVRAIETGEPHPCSGAGGRRAMEMISAVYASHFSDQAVTLPLLDRSDPLAPR